MGRRRKERRQQHGSAWHWNQTDAWYYTLPGTKKRVALFDEQGRRIKGKENQALAGVALAKARLTWGDQPDGTLIPPGQWLVAKVCSDYLQYCERGLEKGTLSKGHVINARSWLNDLCAYCGALPVPQLKKGHITTWIEGHGN